MIQIINYLTIFFVFIALVMFLKLVLRNVDFKPIIYWSYALVVVCILLTTYCLYMVKKWATSTVRKDDWQDIDHELFI